LRLDDLTATAADDTVSVKAMVSATFAAGRAAAIGQAGLLGD
jgi:hypothetical protein